MSRGRQKSRASSSGRAKREIPTASQVTDGEHPVTDGSPQMADRAPDRTAGPKWPLWLVGKNPEHDRNEAISQDAPDADVVADSLSDDTSGNVSADPVSDFGCEITETAPSLRDENKNVRPTCAGVVNDDTDMRKENQMQTAKQLTPVSETEEAEKIDLRDRITQKEGAGVTGQKIALGSMASLFGPVIEDEVKGVRSQIREMIQSELQGELGERFSRNLRIVIRREIAAAVDDQFDRV